MIEFRGRPLTGEEKYDKTGFYILWPLAVFPVFAGLGVLVTDPGAVFKDTQHTMFMILFGIGWTLFWGIIPVLAYQADKAKARRESTYKVRVDEQSIEFDLGTSVCRMNWSEMKSIRCEDPDNGDVTFRSKHKKFCYECWVEDEVGFQREVRQHFPAAEFS